MFRELSFGLFLFFFKPKVDQKRCCWQRAASIKNRCSSPLTNRPQDTRFKVSLQSWPAPLWAFKGRRGPSGPRFVHDSIAQARVKGNQPRKEATSAFSCYQWWGGGGVVIVFDPSFEAQVASELHSYFTLPSLLSSFVLCRCIRARALSPELFNGAFVPPDSRKQPAPNLSNSLWKQQRRPLFLLRAGHRRRSPDMAPAPDAAASLCRCFSRSVAPS